MKQMLAKLPRPLWFALYYLAGIAAVGVVAFLLKSLLALL